MPVFIPRYAGLNKQIAPLWVISGQTLPGQNPLLSALVRLQTKRRWARIVRFLPIADIRPTADSCSDIRTVTVAKEEGLPTGGRTAARSSRCRRLASGEGGRSQQQKPNWMQLN